MPADPYILLSAYLGGVFAFLCVLLFAYRRKYKRKHVSVALRVFSVLGALMVILSVVLYFIEGGDYPAAMFPWLALHYTGSLLGNEVARDPRQPTDSTA